MTTWSLDKPGSTEDPAGSHEADPAGPPSGRSAVILSFPARSSAAASEGWEGEDADCWESVGVLAVRILGNFDRPFVHCEVQAGDREEEGTPGLR